MTWPVLITLAILTFAFKAAGPMIFAKRPMPAWLDDIVRILPLAIYPALVASSVFGSPEGVTFDARAIAAAAVLVLVILVRKRVFGFAMLLGAVVTAGVRALFGP